MKKTISKKTIILIVSVCVIFVLAVSAVTVYPNLLWRFEKGTYTPTAEELAEFYGDSRVIDPPPTFVDVHLRLFPWEKEGGEKHKESVAIASETTDIAKAYNVEYGLGTDLQYKVIKKTPNLLIYKLYGEPNGGVYIVTVDRSSDSPSVTYEKE